MKTQTRNTLLLVLCALIWGLAFVAPPFVGFLLFMAFPIVFAFVASLFMPALGKKVGKKNAFIFGLSSERFRISFS